MPLRPGLPACHAGAHCQPSCGPRSARRATGASCGASVKDGRSSWLFGTIHVGKLPWAFAGPALAQAFAGSDILALELDPLDPAVARQVAAAAQLPPVRRRVAGAAR